MAVVGTVVVPVVVVVVPVVVVGPRHLRLVCAREVVVVVMVVVGDACASCLEPLILYNT
jgi:hypothetical protein